MVLFAAGAAFGAQADEVLPNGLRVLAREQPEATVVSVRLSLPAGAAAEPDSLAGIAHLAEHLLCDGDPWRRLALFGIGPNASTSADAMEFTCRCLPSLLPRILEAEAARLREAHIDSASFVRERSVVLEELAYRGYVQTLGPAAEAFRIAFPGHPFGRLVGGSTSTVARITLEDLRSFVRRSITPRGATLYIDGPIDAAAVFAAVRAEFGDIAGGPEPAALPPYPPSLAGQSIFDDPDHDGYRMALAIRVPVRELRDVALIDLGTAWLEHARIPIAIHQVPGEGVLTFSWYGAYVQWKADWEYLEKTFDPEVDIQRSLEWRWRTLNGAIDELSASRRRDEVAAWLDETVTGSRNLDALNWLPGLDRADGVPTPTLEEYDAALHAVTVAELREFLARTLDPGRGCVAVSHGGDSRRMARQSLAARVGRSSDIAAIGALECLTAADCGPALQAYADAGALPLTRHVLSNGVPVYCLRTPDHDSWRVGGWRRFAPPAECRADKLPGLERLYNRVAGIDPARVEEGRPLRPWAYHGTFSLDPGGRYAFGADGPAGKAAEVGASLVRRLDDPSFNISAWTSALEFGRYDFDIRNRVPQVNAASWRWEQVLGAGHAALSTWRPDTRTLDRVRYEHLQKLHRAAAAGAGRTVLLAAGGEPQSGLLAALESSFGARSPDKAWSPAPPPPGPASPSGLIVPAVGARDVMLTLTFPAALPPTGWAHPGLTMLWLETVVQQVLDLRLRQQGGWTYSVKCNLKTTGGWVVPEISVTCQPGQAPAVLGQVRAELARLAGEGVSADQAARARLVLVQRLVASGTEMEALGAWLSFATAFEPVGNDPVGDVLGLEVATLSASVPALVPAGRFAWTAVGAILEDDVPLFGD